MSELIKESSLTTKDIHLDLLVIAEDNPNSMSDEQVRRLAEDIAGDVGFLDPIDVVPLEDGRFEVMGGEHRIKAARIAGLTYIPAVLHTDAKWTDRKRVTLERFKLNALRGKVGGPALIKLYKQVCDEHGPEKAQSVLAITEDEEWKKLVKSVKQSLKAQGAPDQVLQEVAVAEKKAKSPDDLSQKISKILKKYANSAMSNAVLFQHEGQENILIKSDQTVYDCMKIISEYAQAQGQDVNEILGQALLGVVSAIQDNQER